MAAPNTPPSSAGLRSRGRRRTRAAAEAQQASRRKQAEFARETSVVQAQYKAGVDKARAEAAQATRWRRPTPSARSSRRRPTAQQRAELRQRQLGRVVSRRGRGRTDRSSPWPASAPDPAEAAASNNRVALDQLLINQLPLIVKEAAAGLAGANVSVLNGADGLSEIAAGLVGQGMTILDAVRKGMPGQGQARTDNGQVVSGQVAQREP